MDPILTQGYILEGREIPNVEDDARDVPPAPCIFCGATLEHVNDGGRGWIIGAVKADGSTGMYMHCNEGTCYLESWNAMAQVKEDTPEKDRIVFRCGCTPDYVESVGERCHECKADRANLVPWE